MKTKVKWILGIVDVLLIALLTAMFLLGGTNGKSVESKVSPEEIKSDEEREDETEADYLYDGVIDKMIMVEADSDKQTETTDTENENVSAEDAESGGNENRMEEASTVVQGGRKVPVSYNGDVEADVKKIRARWQKIQDNLNNYNKVNAGSGITHYVENVDGQDVIRKVLVKSGGATEEYFYSYSGGTYEPFFVFVTGADKREDRHYYVDCQLIRWIEAKQGGTIHDLELENEEYVERGEDYLNRAYNNIGL